MKIKVAINGFGRIGRAFLRQSFSRSDLEVVAVNDLGDVHNLAYLLKYDTVFGVFPYDVKAEDGALVVGGKRISFVGEKDPTKLPWKDLGVDVVVESTGFFTKFSDAKAHVVAGAKKVVISAPAKDEPLSDVKSGTVLLGVNCDTLPDMVITSNASCTTNAASPLIAILDKEIGIEKAILNTVHGYTASQSIVDAPNKKDWREGRAAAQNIVPSSTGAALAVTKVATNLAGKFDGISMRVPVVAGSIVDVTFIAKRTTTKDEVNDILKKAAATDHWKNTFAVTEEELVSSDIIGAPYGSIADLKFTRVVDGTLVKVCAWYDNEGGYTHTLIEHVIKLGRGLH